MLHAPSIIKDGEVMMRAGYQPRSKRLPAIITEEDGIGREAWRESGKTEARTQINLLLPALQAPPTRP